MAHYGFTTMSESYALAMARAYNKNTKQSNRNIELSYIGQIHEDHKPSYEQSKTTNPPPESKKKNRIWQITTYGTFN